MNFETVALDTSQPNPDTTKLVSVVIPCFNEERFVAQALESLASQYDPAYYEIIVADGLSVDRTREVIADFARARPQLAIKVVDNPKRSIPAALNLAVRHATGDIIARMDAHAVPSEGYIRRCVSVLNEANVGVVGMPCRVRPGADTLVGRAVASAVSHPFGIGDAKYRLQEGDALQESVDTVAFACFKKSLWSELGGFNEELLTNEDYDFNYRVRMQGKQVILDRSGHCDYFARSTLRDLVRQYSRYGAWKARMVRLHPGSLKLRHVVAPLFVLSIAVLALLGFVTPIFWLLLGLEVLVYLCLAIGFGLTIMQKGSDGIRIWLMMPVVFMAIHLSWGFSFLLGLIKRPNVSLRG